MTRKLKLWNGMGWINGKQVHLSVAAFSMADAATLLRERGVACVSPNYIKTHWSPCWGTAQEKAVPTPARGVWDFAGKEVA